MPFKSEKQRRYLWANEPEIARDWTDTYGSRIEKNDGGIMRVGLRRGSSGPGPGGQGARGQATQNPGVGGSSAPPGRDPRGPHTGMHYTAPKPPQLGGEGPKDYHIPKKPKDKPKLKDKIKKQITDSFKARQRTAYNLTTNKKLAKQYRQNYKNYLNKLGIYDYPTSLDDEDELANFWVDDAVGYKPTPYKDMYGDQVISPLNYGDFLAKYEGAPGLKYSGNVGNLEKFKNADGTYGYREITGGEGPIYYPGYVPGGTPQGGGGTSVTEVVEDTPSGFQESLTTSTSSPFDYYVGQDPTAANLAWGQKFGVDPRTMYRTSWAADGGRIGRAYGGIMDTATGRRAYGLGSIFKSVKRAASKVLKSPIGKAALIGGLGLYGANAGWFGATNPFFGKTGHLAPFLRKNIAAKGMPAKWGGYSLGKLGIGAASLLPFFMGGEEEDEGSKFDYDAAKNAYRDEMMRIKAGSMAGTLDPNKFSYLPTYKDGGRIGLSNGGDPLLLDEYKKYVFEMEEMGLTPMTFEEFKAQARAGMYAGGQSVPSEYTMEDAMMTTTQDKLGGITDVMKQADLNRKGSVGQFYAADGGRIGYAMGSNKTAWGMDTARKAWDKLGTNSKLGYVDFVDFFLNGPWGSNQYRTGSDKLAEGGRIGAQEGGLMDLGGMEKDYRNDGGFVPIGGEEKADDVPARLSRNEFVFTADAVRGAGDGDIDKGAEIMENVMKNLEQGGQISEETQGLSGAQEMFGVSERLSEVV